MGKCTPPHEWTPRFLASAIMTLEEPDQQRRAFVLKSSYILEATDSLNNGQKAVIKLAAPAVSLGKVISDRDASSIANFFQ